MKCLAVMIDGTGINLLFGRRVAKTHAPSLAREMRDTTEAVGGVGKWHAGSIAVVMVGLPATGKTFTARNLSRYLRWLGIRTKTFSVAHYRTRVVGDRLNAEFFDPDNAEFLRKRTLIADEALGDMLEWFAGGGQVGILDASNTLPARRKIIKDRFDEAGIRPVFLECLYSTKYEVAISEHVRQIRLTCPEYAGLSNEDIRADFNQRINYYRPFYVKVGAADEGEEGYAFIKLVDGGVKLVVNRVHGYLPSRMLYYLMNLHLGCKRILLYSLPATPVNLCDYARPAQKYLLSVKGLDGFSVWTETSLMSCEVGDLFPGHELLTKPQLRGRDTGVAEGLSDEELQQRWPEEYAAQQADPYNHRYTRAESYHDLAVRLENVMMELEREPHNVLIMADVSVLRCIYAYFLEIPNQALPSIDVAPCSLIELRPKAYGVWERRILLREACEPLISEEVFHPFAEDSQ